eukprot:TRINITY_DN1382_c0_g1_i5.p1 TRINITY_DN1382_c0_g1~~TRINITY_DN1382_c0_g1_i5.p1  ORF type:complete len:514 (+),score=150.24 TRINITY_DN1382_c0_g1_i5:146-1687(+)
MEQLADLVLVCKKMRRPELFESHYTSHGLTQITLLLQLEQKHESFEAVMQWLGGFYDKVLNWSKLELQCGLLTFPDEAPQLLQSVLSRGLLAAAPKLAAQFDQFKPADPLAQLASIGSIVAVVSQFLSSLAQLFGEAWDTDVSSAACEPLIALWQRCGPLEEQLLLSAAEGWVAPCAVTEVSKMIEDSVAPFFELCSSCVERCITITGGSEAVALISALNTAITKYCVCVESKVADTCSRDEGAEIWSQLQVALQSLSCCKGLHKKLHALDLILRAQLKPRVQAVLASHKQGTPGCLRYLQLSQSPDQLQHLEGLHELIQSSPSAQVLSFAVQKVRALMEAVDGLATAVMFNQINAELSKFAQLPVWAEEAGSGAAPGLTLPSFSCSPLGYITGIGEYLLVLPQHLEGFAPRAREGDAEQFVHKWVSKLARMAADLYIGQLLTMPRLSGSGAAQLAADMQYLVNVLKALAIDPHPKLLQSIQALQASQSELEESYASSKSAQFLKAVALKRGF